MTDEEYAILQRDKFFKENPKCGRSIEWFINADTNNPCDINDYKLDSKKKTIKMLSSRSWGGVTGSEMEWEINEFLNVTDWSENVISAYYIGEYGTYGFYSFLIKKNLLIQSTHNPYGDSPTMSDVYDEVEKYVDMKLWTCEK